MHKPNVEQRRIGRPPKERTGISELRGDVGVISLTMGKVAIVDAADFEWLSQWVWSAVRSKTGWYATRAGENGPERMHRLVMGVSDSRVLVDHRDRDGLNNRRGNLRVCTNAQNMRNSAKRRNNTTGYKGVVLQKPSGRFLARITTDRVETHLGTFDTAYEAALAYDAAARRQHGEFACTNFEDSLAEVASC
jgi:hypothetical protein